MNNKEPCIVETTQGFSVLYNEKLLYSKYNPSRAIISQIEKLTILPGTLILCNSPVLEYGLTELSEKLPPKCFMLGVELEAELADFIATKKGNHSNIKNFSMLSYNEALELPVLLSKIDYTLASGIKLPSAGSFKRVIFLDFSAGSLLHKNLYEKIFSYSVNAIMTFWKNRITLTKFGRRYSQDFFRNLKLLHKTTPIQNYFSSVEKPIIVFGSGESIDKGIQYIKKDSNKYFILCADTALQPLLLNGIEPQGVFIEEAQNVIIKAFIGTQKADFTVFAGLSSLSQLSHTFPLEKLCYFTTEYTQACFINNLKSRELLPPVNQPFGSVGLTTFYYALLFRKNDSIPVYTYGLDFSYTKGRTHGKGTMAHTNLLCGKNRLNSIYNLSASYGENSVKVNQNNNETEVFSTPLLLSYSALFTNLFTGQYKNIFNSSDISNTIGLPYKLPEPNENTCTFSLTKTQTYLEEKLVSYINEEISALENLKALLTGQTELQGEELSLAIKKLASPREYLYLHFPDGHQFTYSQDFLNRIRIEIDFFLKILK
ncbi:MAG: DUF115 domain-containing protein [Treponema sp.]|nr:DUF115 domain-containing protein [Treponema sp.]